MFWEFFVDFWAEVGRPQVQGHDLVRAFYAESVSFELFKKVCEV